MPQEPVSKENDFHKLLAWISVPGYNDGDIYEDIRYRLIKYFQSKGCLDSESLADDAIERVTRKIDKISETFEGNPLQYFYGVARNMVKEDGRRPRLQKLPFDYEAYSNKLAQTAEVRDQCLEHCLERLDSDERRFILEYYFGERATKIQNRLRLRKEFGLTRQSIGVKAFRIREKLQRCVIPCVKGAEK